MYLIYLSPVWSVSSVFGTYLIFEHWQSPVYQGLQTQLLYSHIIYDIHFVCVEQKITVYYFIFHATSHSSFWFLSNVSAAFVTLGELGIYIFCAECKIFVWRVDSLRPLLPIWSKRAPLSDPRTTSK